MKTSLNQTQLRVNYTTIVLKPKHKNWGRLKNFFFELDTFEFENLAEVEVMWENLQV